MYSSPESKEDSRSQTSAARTRLTSRRLLALQCQWMAYLAAITEAGVPLFIRTKGDLPPLSFPVLGSLNGVHLFASNLKASLLSCVNGGAKTVWKCYSESITLILVTAKDSPSDVHQTHMLDLVFNGMILLVGLHELENIANIERLKRDLKSCYPLIDHLLRGSSALMSPLTQCADVITVDDYAILQSSVEAFAEAAQSNYGCLAVNGRVCAATDSWWDLSSLEISLLSLFLTSLPPSSCRDIPVYLPKASNRTAHRLLVFTLIDGIDVCVLCGPEPSLKMIQGLLEEYWRGMLEILRSCVHTFPRCVPLRLNFDPSVLAFCLVNLDTRRCLTSLKPSTGPESHRTALSQGFQGELDPHRRHTYLTRFYKTVVDNLLPAGKTPELEEPELPSCALHETLPHKILETYICAKRYKAYALHRDSYNLFVLFSSNTPTFALKKMTSDVFATLLTQDKPVL